MKNVSNGNNEAMLLPQARSECALANGLEILGDRWTILIIRDLMFTNRNEFGHLLNSGEGISTNILTERLNRLQQYGIVEKLPHPTHGRKSIYQLTEKGTALAPVMTELALWAYNTIEGTFIPEPVFSLMQQDRQQIYNKVAAREPLVIIDL